VVDGTGIEPVTLQCEGPPRKGQPRRGSVVDIDARDGSFPVQWGCGLLLIDSAIDTVCVTVRALQDSKYEAEFSGWRPFRPSIGANLDEFHEFHIEPLYRFYRLTTRASKSTRANTRRACNWSVSTSMECS
jgi:hypothetical protein